MRRGCTVTLYDHTEYTRTRAFQTLRASLWDHVANGYLLKQDVEEIMVRISVAHTLEELSHIIEENRRANTGGGRQS